MQLRTLLLSFILKLTIYIQIYHYNLKIPFCSDGSVFPPNSDVEDVVTGLLFLLYSGASNDKECT